MRTMARVKRHDVTLPVGVDRQVAGHRRAVFPARSEQTSAESTSGSIGTTGSGK
jgi:hypothetical protein